MSSDKRKDAGGRKPGIAIQSLAQGAKFHYPPDFIPLPSQSIVIDLDYDLGEADSWER